mmetsp:Transcript_3405/g.10395  ORF Transcript_3405/g.10395 Transcript_3405/m.10395 type:complete len:80 (+) Transcript_3405:384-623(+)
MEARAHGSVARAAVHRSEAMSRQVLRCGVEDLHPGPPCSKLARLQRRQRQQVKAEVVWSRSWPAWLPNQSFKGCGPNEA